MRQKIKTTGFHVMGFCDIKTSYCVARDAPAALTVVLTQPNGNQLNVCPKCLQEMVLSEQWEVPGARILPDQKERILAARREKELVPA